MNDATQTGVAMAAIAMIATVMGSVISYLKDRDKLRYDNELAALKHQNAGQATQLATLTVAQIECERRHRECEEKHQTNSQQIAEIRAMLLQKKDDAGELRICDIERVLAGKKDDTAEHRPVSPPK